MSKIRIKINGKELDVKENSTVKDLLEERKVTGTMFVVERNLEIIPKDQYHQVIVEENDNFEVVGLFGGG